MTPPPIRLRLWSPDDVDDLTALANERDIWRNLTDSFPHPYTRADAMAWIVRNTTEEGLAHDFAIELDGELAGAAGITPKTDVYRIGATIGFWVARPYWGNGIATEAVRQLVHYAFDAFSSNGSRRTSTTGTPPRPVCWRRTASSSRAGATVPC